MSNKTPMASDTEEIDELRERLYPGQSMDEVTKHFSTPLFEPEPKPEKREEDMDNATMAQGQTAASKAPANFMEETISQKDSDARKQAVDHIRRAMKQLMNIDTVPFDLVNELSATAKKIRGDAAAE